MDPISIITLCASTTATAYHVSATIYSFINSARNIDAEVEALAREITGVRRVLDAIGIVFANPILKSDESTSVHNGPIWAAVAGALNDCRISIERLDSQLSADNRRSTGKNFFKQSVKWMKLSFKVEDIARLRFQMNTHANNLQISLQLVTILVTTADPARDQSAAVGDDYSRLQSSVQQLALVEEKLASEDKKDLQKQTDYLKHTANAVLQSLESASAIALDKKEQQASRDRLRHIVADFNSSLYDRAEAEDPEDAPPDYESDPEKDAGIELELALKLFSQGESYFKERQFLLAETVVREGFQHLKTINAAGEGVDIVQMQLLLIKACMWQDKWQTAELMLMVLVRPSASRKVTPTILEAYHLLAQTHLCQYDFDSALEYCRQAYAGRKRVFGAAHTNTISSLRLLALIHRANGDSISGDAYDKLTSQSSVASEENDIVNARFDGYSSKPCLRLSLREKATAIRELSKQGYLSNAPHQAATDNAWTELKPRESLFHPVAVDVDLGKALHWVAETDLEVVARWLLARGADPDHQSHGYPSLVTAASGGHSAVVKIMLQAGADPDAVDLSNRSSLIWTALRGHNETTQVLIDHGADVNWSENDGCTPLMDAAIKGHDSTVRLLLKHGAKVDPESGSRSTALYYACDSAFIESIRALLQYGADPRVTGPAGRTPLHIAAQGRTDSVLHLLIGAGADVNARDASGETPLHYLPHGGNVASLKLLLAAGAEVDSRSDDGHTMLLEFVYRGSVPQARLLLQHGADAVTERRDGLTAMQVARQQRHEGMVALLREYGVAADDDDEAADE